MTSEQRRALAQRFADGTSHPDMDPEYQALDIEARHLVGLELYFILRQRTRKERGPAQRRAMALLRSWLTDEQRAQLRSNKEYFTVVGSAGGRYRLWPRGWGSVRCERVERHGGRDYALGVTYCYHDPEFELPAADVILGHLLLIRANEPAFLAEANAHERSSNLWDGAWLRRLRAARQRPEYQREIEEARARVLAVTLRFDGVAGQRQEDAA